MQPKVHAYRPLYSFIVSFPVRTAEGKNLFTIVAKEPSRMTTDALPNITINGINLLKIKPLTSSLLQQHSNYLRGYPKNTNVN